MENGGQTRAEDGFSVGAEQIEEETRSGKRAADAAPRISDGVERSLDPRSVSLQLLTGWIAALVSSLSLLIGLLFVLLLAPLPFWAMLLLIFLWLGAAVAMAWSAQWWPAIEHRHASYRVDALGIQIRRGVLWRRSITIPRSRVQHIDVSQGPLERSYGLGTLVIYTAGAEYARVSLHGLDHETALRIRDHLLPRGMDDAV